MITVECNSKTYSYIFNIDGSYTVSASCVEEAKKNVLEMIEDGMNAAINKKLDSSFVDKILDMEGNVVDIGQVNEVNGRYGKCLVRGESIGEALSAVNERLDEVIKFNVDKRAEFSAIGKFDDKLLE